MSNISMPTPQSAAADIHALACSAEYSTLNEPARAAAYALGYAEFDGTDWWHATMDIVSDTI